MIAPRWRKVVRDVVRRPGRSLLVVLALATGIFQITTMLYTYALLQPELTSMYGRTRPASATLYLDAADDSVVAVVRGVPGVAAAEARPVVVARALVRGAGNAGGDEWVPLVLFVVRDFNRLAMDTFRPDRGAWPPGPGEVLLERSALQVAKVEPEDSLLVRATGTDDRSVRVAGTVWAAGLAPAWMEHQIPGFVAWNSVLRGGASESAQIRIVTDHPLDEGSIHEVADRVRATLEARGHEVTRVNVPVPGKHPHADQMAAFLFLLLSFGVLSFVLSAVLVASTTQALMAEQVKQVGVMKAIGGTDRQISALYLGHVALLAAAALAIGVPLGLWAGRGYALFSAGILNADIVRDGFPVWVVLVAAVGGIGVPLLTALGPVARAARVTVREALSDDAAGAGAAHHKPLGAGWPRPLAYSLRATLGRRGRFAVTVTMLALGGAAFLSALNVADAWIRSVNADFARRKYDLGVGLASSQTIATVDSILARVEGVERVEYWSTARPYLVDAQGVAGGVVTMIGLPADTKLLDLQRTSGRWLEAGDAEGAVVNQALAASHGALAVGDTVKVRLGEKTLALPVRGIVRELAPMPTIYVQRGVILAAADLKAERTRGFQIVTSRHDDAGQRGAARRVEAAFRDAGIEVSGVLRMEDQKKGILDHLVIILSILTLASSVVVVVGVLGLTSALALGVVQRTREFGVLSAIGATPGLVARIVWLEGLALGFAGWIGAVVVALPITWALETIVGSIFFRAPLEFYVSPLAAAAWLAIALVLASLASLAPARRAARLTAREAMNSL